MYIPDKEWDGMVSWALQLLEMPDVTANRSLTGLMNVLINQEDQPFKNEKFLSTAIKDLNFRNYQHRVISACERGHWSGLWKGKKQILLTAQDLYNEGAKTFFQRMHIGTGSLNQVKQVFLENGMIFN